MDKNISISKELKSAIENNNLIFFIGAGTSIPLKFPSWKGLILEILNELKPSFKDNCKLNFDYIISSIESGNKDLLYALNELEGDDDNTSTFITKSKEKVHYLLDKKESELLENSKVHELITNISKKIITTNYDRVFEIYNPSINVIENSNSFQAIKAQTKDIDYIYKLHGSSNNPDSLILFKSDYDNMYQDNNPNIDALKNLFKNSTLLFIGFSMSDPYIKQLFKNLKNLYGGYTINKHFILSTNDTDNFSEFDIESIRINDWEDDLKSFLKTLNNIKKNEKSLLQPLTEENQVESINNTIQQKITELRENPNNKELLKEIKYLKNELDLILYGDLDNLININPEIHNTYIKTIFDNIYSSDKINNNLYNEILEIRNNKNNYKWYERSVIISSIACSLIHFNKADERKISLLIDFIVDNEEKVWQKATTYLFIVLNHLGNKWIRYPSIIKKVQSLNHNLQIQYAYSDIIKIFSIGLNNIHLHENLFNNDYFKDEPFNYFLPFYQQDNLIFDEIYDNYQGNDIESYIEFLHLIPIPDQLKYLSCLTQYKNSKQENIDIKRKNSLLNILSANKAFYPFSIYIQEFISFYKYYPQYKHDEKLKSQLKLTETPINKYLLNDKEKYSSLGFYFMSKNEFKNAIKNYQLSLKIDKNDTSILMDLANCYSEINELSNEIKVRENIFEIDDSLEINLEILISLYISDEIKNYDKALYISNILLTKDDNNSQYNYLNSLVHYKFKNYNDSIFKINKAITLKNDEPKYYFNRYLNYDKLKDFDNSIKDLNILIQLDKTTEHLTLRAEYYYENSYYEEAIIDVDSAIELSPKDYELYALRGFYKSFTLDFDSAIEDLTIAKLNNVSENLLTNNYTNYYRLKGEFENAFKTLEKNNINNDPISIGTKATIYSSMGNDDEFYNLLDRSLEMGAEASRLFTDIKMKYKDENRFLEILKKYNMEI